MFKFLFTILFLTILFSCSEKDESLSSLNGTWFEEYKGVYTNLYININDDDYKVDSITYSVELSLSDSLYEVNLNSLYHYSDTTLSAITSYNGNYKVVIDTITFNDTIRDYYSTQPSYLCMDTVFLDSSSRIINEYLFELSKSSLHLKHNSLPGTNMFSLNCGIPWGMSFIYKWEGYFTKQE